VEKWEGAVEPTELETPRSETVSISSDDASSAVEEEMLEGDDGSASEADDTEEEGLTTDGSENDDPWLPVRRRVDEDRRPQLSGFAQLMNQLMGWATPATGAYLHGCAFDPTQGASTVRLASWRVRASTHTISLTAARPVRASRLPREHTTRVCAYHYATGKDIPYHLLREPRKQPSSSQSCRNAWPVLNLRPILDFGRGNRRKSPSPNVIGHGHTPHSEPPVSPPQKHNTPLRCNAY
jgi:hypothetical protein